MPKGNCFENSFRYITDARVEEPERDLTLVHCLVIGTGGDVMGVEYSHAFVIERTPIPMDEGTYLIGDPFIETAIDCAKDYNNPIHVPLGFYRNVGGVHNEIHYHREEARLFALEKETYGPWDDSIDSEADRKANA